MGALLALPLMYEDHTSSLGEWEQITFRSLSAEFKKLIDDAEDVWQARFRDNIGGRLRYSSNADLICPGVWLGSYSAATDIPWLDGNEVSAILNMAEECDYQAPPWIKTIKIGIDDAKIANKGAFLKAAEVINRAVESNNTILVHCAAGISRSSTAVISYLMAHKGFTWASAFDLVTEKRECANPHPLLIRSLMRDLGDRFQP